MTLLAVSHAVLRFGIILGKQFICKCFATAIGAYDAIPGVYPSNEWNKHSAREKILPDDSPTESKKFKWRNLLCHQTAWQRWQCHIQHSMTLYLVSLTSSGLSSWRTPDATVAWSNNYILLGRQEFNHLRWINLVYSQDQIWYIRSIYARGWLGLNLSSFVDAG